MAIRPDECGTLSAEYGITKDKYDEMLREQHGCCAICSKTMKEPCVDHCHETNVVRGLLCHSCNRGLGLLQDNPDNLFKAGIYLSAFKRKAA